MKITDIRFEKMSLKLTEPFVIALGTIEAVDVMLVRVDTDEGIAGFGEAAPFEHVTGEYIEGVAAALKSFSAGLTGADPMCVARAHTIMDGLAIGNSSSKAAIDMALYDIIGKKLGEPVYKLLGGESNRLVTDVTIGIGSMEQMLREARDITGRGYTEIKVKAGLDPAFDMEVARALRQTLGDAVRIRVDANQGWSENDAIRVMREYEKYNIDEVEQPLPYWNIEGMRYVREHTRIKLMADESVHTPMDAMRLARSNAVDMFNIKLMKCGGLYPAMQINAIAESAGINCMLGCMMESELAITAAASLIAAQKNITDGDMDSYLSFTDKRVKGSFTVENGIMTLSDKPGLGVEVDMAI